jgi:hypothetical protein
MMLNAFFGHPQPWKYSVDDLVVYYHSKGKGSMAGILLIKELIYTTAEEIDRRLNISKLAGIDVGLNVDNARRFLSKCRRVETTLTEIKETGKSGYFVQFSDGKLAYDLEKLDGEDGDREYEEADILEGEISFYEAEKENIPPAKEQKMKMKVTKESNVATKVKVLHADGSTTETTTSVGEKVVMEPMKD